MTIPPDRIPTPSPETRRDPAIPFDGRHPLVPAALAFAAGTALAAWLPPFSCRLPAGLGLAALLFWGAALSRRLPAPTACAALLFFILLGFIRFDAHRPEGIDGGALAIDDATAEGKVADAAEMREDSLVFNIEDVTVEHSGGTFRLHGILQVFLRDFDTRPVPGERILLRGAISPIVGDRNLTWFPEPVDPSRRRIAARLYVNSPLWVRPSGSADPIGPALAVSLLREKAVRLWDDDGRPAAALLKALTTGQRRAIPDDVRRSFYRSGLAHLLAVSGLHLGIIAVFLYFLLRRMLAFAGPLIIRYPVQPFAAAATIPVLAVVYLFTGQQISAGRAAIMAGLGLAAVIAGRRTDILNLVALAALTLLYADPLLLFSASFQLSFSAVTMLVLAAPRFPRLPERYRRRWWHRSVFYIATLVLTSLVAALATAPVAAYHFNRISFAGPAANLAAVPLTCFVVLPLGWAALTADLIPGIPASAIADAAVRSGELLIATADIFARLPFSSVSVTRPPPFSVIVMITLAAMLCSGHRWPRALTVPLSAAAAALWITVGAGEGFRMHFFDVGQGEASLLRLPGGETILIDTGPAWRRNDAGRFIVSPALRALGVRRIDALVLSHLHPDHAGGLASLLEEFPVDEIWSPPFDRGRCPPPTAAAIHRHEKRGGKVRLFRRGDRIESSSGVRIDILNPPQPPWRGTGSVNDNSLVMLFSWGECRLLMTGDIGSAPALDIAGRLPAPGGLSILKVPHHGGRQGGASSLTSSFRPILSVISVGRNRYGHPAPDVVKAYAAEGRVIRTDREGGILVRCARDVAEARTWKGLSLHRSMIERFRWFFRGY